MVYSIYLKINAVLSWSCSFIITFFYLSHIICLFYISFLQIEFKLFGGQELAMAFFFFVVLEFCILLVTDVQFRYGVIKTNKQPTKYLT